MGIIAFFGTKSIGEAYRKRPGRRELSVGPVTGYLGYMTIFLVFPLEEQGEDQELDDVGEGMSDHGVADGRLRKVRWGPEGFWNRNTARF